MSFEPRLELLSVYLLY